MQCLCYYFNFPGIHCLMGMGFWNDMHIVEQSSTIYILIIGLLSTSLVELNKYFVGVLLCAFDILSNHRRMKCTFFTLQISDYECVSDVFLTTHSHMLIHSYFSCYQHSDFIN